jgi:hypothetical protein
VVSGGAAKVCRAPGVFLGAGIPGGIPPEGHTR